MSELTPGTLAFDLEASKKFLNSKFELPDYIQDNLAKHIQLRPYQKDALQNFFLVQGSIQAPNKNKLLFNMATGSGKTVIMASLILYYYKQGYRNFLFFVNQNNILAKTIDNFTAKNTSKYLFADSVHIDNKRVKINNVSNFSATSSDSINICFSTAQGIFNSQMAPKENGLSADDFIDNKVVFISDESHHINASTKNQKKDEASWENAIDAYVDSNSENVLLEFTATIDLSDKNIFEKYKDRVVVKYDLRSFREDGYTKDFKNIRRDCTPWERTLGALVLSEYRRALFEEINISSKPVVLVRSENIPASKKFYKEFFTRLNLLTADEILLLNSNELLSVAIDYFKQKDSSLKSLIEGLKNGFSEERSQILNHVDSFENDEQQRLVNTLEDSSNPIRILFTVQMLVEGWDVLNLYDIVRLSEKRQPTKNGPSKYTLSEAQLIGRGARYNPFTMPANSNAKDKRKFDLDVKNKYRILETMYFHCIDSSRYISELNQALVAMGLKAEEIIEREYKIKDSFKSSKFFHELMVFSNKREKTEFKTVNELDADVRQRTYYLDITHHDRIGDFNLKPIELESQSFEADKPDTYNVTIKFSDIPLNISKAWIDRYPSLSFNNIKQCFPNLKSIHEFLTDSRYLADIKIDLLVSEKLHVITAIEYQKATEVVFDQVSAAVDSLNNQYVGTKSFEGKKLSTIVKDKVLRFSNIVTDGEHKGRGISQNTLEPSSEMYLNLEKADWYIFNDNYGTDQEKKFLSFFSKYVAHLEEIYDYVCVVRNESFDEMAIYDFDEGRRFEPDFLVFMVDDKGDNLRQEQIFVEPKGGQLKDGQIWKQDFLLQIEKEGIPHKIYVDNTEYRIIGLPFFQDPGNLSVFRPAFEKFVK